MELNKIYNIDCLDGMKQLDDNSIDAVVTDPPYGIAFMNKKWDSFKGQGMRDFFNPIWKEALRVLKPGSFAAVMSSPRSDVMAQQIYSMIEAGFVMEFSPVFWAYSSGFPKGMNISRAVDRKLGYERKQTSIVEKRTGRRDSGIYYMNLNGEDKHIFPRFDEPASPEAKKLDGSFAGFQPKPAVEVIIIGMKPLSEKTYLEQAMKDGKGITWLDDCRIPYVDDADKEGRKRGIKNAQDPDTLFSNFGPVDSDLYISDKGRFPANLLVSDDVLNDGTIMSSSGHVRINGKPKEIFGRVFKEFKPPPVYSDSGSFSKYFDLDMWYSRNIKQLPTDAQKVYPFFLVTKASQDERHKGIYSAADTVTDGRKESIDNPYQRGETLRRNIHPTVKPVKLMVYLITMLTRANDVVMDPFMGSGTTAMAARMIGRQYIGFEKNNEYHSVAEQRIAATPIQKTLDGIA